MIRWGFACLLVSAWIGAAPAAALGGPQSDQRRPAGARRASSRELGAEAILAPRRLNLMPSALSIRIGAVGDDQQRYAEYVLVRDAQSRERRARFIAAFLSRIVVGPRLQGPIFESWNALDYSPVGRGAYYCAPYYMRSQASYGVNIK